MAVEIATIAERLERSGATPGLARAIATELVEVVRGEVVTREYLDLALGKLRAEVERDLGRLRADLERDSAQLRAGLDLRLAELRAGTQQDIAAQRLETERTFREQANRILVWMATIVGVAATVIGGLGVLF